MGEQGVTIQELYRLCERIEEAVKEQNGRVRKLENDAIRIKTLWSAGAVMVALFGGWVRAKLGF